MKLSFVVPGNPVPKARARKGKGGHWHTPQKTIDYEQCIAWTARGAAIAPVHLRWPIDAEYRVTATCYFKDHRTRDVINVLMSVCDALKGVLYKDDVQVGEPRAKKMFDAKNPRLEVEVEVL